MGRVDFSSSRKDGKGLLGTRSYYSGLHLHQHVSKLWEASGILPQLLDRLIELPLERYQEKFRTADSPYVPRPRTEPWGLSVTPLFLTRIGSCVFNYLVS